MKELKESDAAFKITVLTSIKDVTEAAIKYDMYFKQDGEWKPVGLNQVAYLFFEKGEDIYCFPKEGPETYYWGYYCKGWFEEKLSQTERNTISAIKDYCTNHSILVLEKDLVPFVKDVYEFITVMKPGTEDVFDFGGLKLWVMILTDDDGPFARILDYKSYEGSSYISIIN